MCTYSICESLNIWAVLVATVAYFMVGALWYSPVLFANTWMVESKVTPDKSKSLVKYLIITFFITLFMVLVLAFLISISKGTSSLAGLKMGLLVGIGFVATTLGITFLYEGRSLKLFLIDAGYHITGLLIAGLILGMWK